MATALRFMSFSLVCYVGLSFSSPRAKASAGIYDCMSSDFSQASCGEEELPLFENNLPIFVYKNQFKAIVVFAENVLRSEKFNSAQDNLQTLVLPHLDEAYEFALEEVSLIQVRSCLNTGGYGLRTNCVYCLQRGTTMYGVLRTKNGKFLIYSPTEGSLKLVPEKLKHLFLPPNGSLLVHQAILLKQ